jgi:hypothetical protein
MYCNETVCTTKQLELFSLLPMQSYQVFCSSADQQGVQHHQTIDTTLDRHIVMKNNNDWFIHAVMDGHGDSSFVVDSLHYKLTNYFSIFISNRSNELFINECESTLVNLLNEVNLINKY